MVSILNNLLSSTLTASNTGIQSNPLLKVGQIITVNVDKIQGNQVFLTLGNQSIVATSKQPIEQTGSLQVQIKQTQPTLELAITQNNKSSLQQQQAQIIQATYRQLLPSQTSLTQAAQQLTQLQNIPPQLLGPVSQLLEQITRRAATPTGSELKNQLHNSGLFLESKLRDGQSQSLKNDVKAQLLQIKQQADALNIQKPSPQLSQLSSILSQALNRLTIQQIQLFENPLITSFELPFERERGIAEDYIEFRRHTKESPFSWEVLIDLTLDDGNMSTKLILNKENQLSCYIWCDNALLERKVIENIEQLQQNLTNNQLTIQNLQIVKQKPERSQQSTQVALIDIHI